MIQQRAAAAKRFTLWGGWLRLWDRREAGTSLALFRIACGLCITGAVGAVVIDGAVPLLWLPPAHGGYTVPSAPWQFGLLGGVTPLTVGSMIALTLAGGLLTTAGLGGRLSILLALQGYLALVRLNADATGSYDFAICNALWLLFLSQSTATLSLDCKLRTGRWTSDRQIPAWPRYLCIFQLMIIYWSTGLHKLSVYWTPMGDFSALYYILQQPTWQRWDMSWLAWFYPVTQFATAVTWFWEITSPLLLLALWRRAQPRPSGLLRTVFSWVNYRRLFVAIGVAVHLGIFVFMEVGPFSWIMLAYYLTLYDPGEWRSFYVSWSSRFSVARPSEATGVLGILGNFVIPCFAARRHAKA